MGGIVLHGNVANFFECLYICDNLLKDVSDNDVLAIFSANL